MVVTAQTSEMAISYYLPRTTAQVKVTYKQTTYQAGKYAEWAEELLGIDNAIQTDSMAYTVLDASLYFGSEPDTTRCYKVVPEPGLRMQYLSLTHDGILSGYNVVTRMDKVRQPAVKESKKPNYYTKHAPSLLEGVYDTDTLYVQAMEIAEQIYHLRDNRIYLLSGDTENIPQDGESMKMVLDEIERQEKDLVKLFTGRYGEEVISRVYTLDPGMAQDTVLAQIGQEEVIAHVTTTANEAEVVVADPKAKKAKNAPVASQLYYNIPGMAELKVSCGERVLAEERTPVAQLGHAVAIERALLEVGHPLVEIHFDTVTGNILSISEKPQYNINISK